MKRITAMVITCVMIVGSVACGNQEEALSNTGSITDAEVQQSTDDTLHLNGSNMENSIRLADAIYKDKLNNDEQSNIMISPLSLNLALGLLAEGADDNTQSAEALENYLGENFSEEASTYIHDKIQRFNIKSNNEYDRYNTVFEIANSVWFSNTLTIDDTYKANVVDKYDAEIDNIDTTKSEESATKVNNWCTIKTHDMIQRIIEPADITSITSAILVNSVYLESQCVE